MRGSVTGVRRTTQGFAVLLADEVVSARRVLVATGLRDELPDLPGVRERWGRDLLHCPYCHGFEVRDEKLAVLGGSPEAVSHAQLLRQWSSDVVLFSHTDELTVEAREGLVARGIGIVDGHVKRLVTADDRLSGVELADGRFVSRSAVFVRPRFVPNTRLLTDLGCVADSRGWVVADAVGRTSEPGVWVVGNATNPRAQVITAAGEGSAAAIAMNQDLVDEEVRDALRDFRGVGLSPDQPPPQHDLSPDAAHSPRSTAT
jgi:thioredoxin reductase